VFFGVIPPGRDDLWKRFINYYLNCIVDVDAHLGTVLDALEESGQADNTVIVFTSDHGELAGAHGLRQKGGVPFREVFNVPLAIVHPEGARGATSAAVTSAVDLVPTLLPLAGVPTEELRERYPGVVGRDVSEVIFDPAAPGPRGSADQPGDGALYTHDMLQTYDVEWLVRNRESIMQLVKSDAAPGRPAAPEEEGHPTDLQSMLASMERPDFSKRNLFRAVFDGRHKLVRFFGARGYDTPGTVEQLLADNDVALYDLEADPGELRNLAHPDDPAYDPALLASLNAKLNALVKAEIGTEVSVIDKLPAAFRTMGSAVES